MSDGLWAMGWVTFRLSKGYFFNCQGSDETAQVGHFSIVKWVLFRLTKTPLAALVVVGRSDQV